VTRDWVRWGVLAALAACGAAVVTAFGAARPAAAVPAGKPPAILLIVIDALRADRTSLYGHTRPTTPRLDARAPRLRYFTDVITAAPQTVPAIGSIFTGLPARELNLLFDWKGNWWPPRGQPFLFTRTPTLAERLHKAGYRTVAFVTNPWIRRDTGFAFGFDTFVDWVQIDGKATADGARVVDRAVAELATSDGRPLFLYAHLMDVHYPYEKGHHEFVKTAGKQQFRNGPMQMPPDDLRFMSELYDSNVKYADALVARLLDEAERRYKGRFVACILGDHGEELLEHGGMGHGTTLYGEQVRIPLVFYGPGIVTRSGASAYPLQSTDLMPLLLSLGGGGDSPLAGLLRAGVPEPAPPSQPRMSELYDWRMVTEGRWKYIVRADASADELYDLERDPGETHNLAASGERALTSLRREARTLWPQFRAGSRPTKPSA
jgi:arylsulfatase A-like enzyme